MKKMLLPIIIMIITTSSCDISFCDIVLLPSIHTKTYSLVTAQYFSLVYSGLSEDNNIIHLGAEEHELRISFAAGVDEKVNRNLTAFSHIVIFHDTKQVLYNEIIVHNFNDFKRKEDYLFCEYEFSYAFQYDIPIEVLSKNINIEIVFMIENEFGILIDSPLVSTGHIESNGEIAILHEMSPFEYYDNSRIKY